jgi:hypothetical protein
MQISVAEGLEDFDDDLAKGVGSILHEGPPGGRQQFLRRGFQLPQIAHGPIQRFLIDVAHRDFLNTEKECLNKHCRTPTKL